MQDYAKLTKTDNFFGYSLNSHLALGLEMHFDWGFINAGGFQNVTIPQSGIYGGANHRLRAVDDPNYFEGQVWETYRNNWVWETGLAYSAQPIDISGVWVNNVFYHKNGTGAYSHIINYPDGRIIFNNPISTGDIVSLNYSYKRVHVRYEENDWYHRLMVESMKFTADQFHQFSSGIWDELGQTRIQLPAVIIEIDGGSSPKGFELGDNNQYVYRNIIFNVIAENRWEKDSLVDYIQLENHKGINLINLKTLNDNNKQPLDINGSRVSGAQMYPYLTDYTNGYVWKGAYIKDATVQSMGAVSQGIFGGIVQMVVEVII